MKIFNANTAPFFETEEDFEAFKLILTLILKILFPTTVFVHLFAEFFLKNNSCLPVSFSWSMNLGVSNLDIQRKSIFGEL